MIAAREGRTKVVPLLLEAGANTNLQNKVKCVQKYEVQGRECGRYDMCIHGILQNHAVIGLAY